MDTQLGTIMIPPATISAVDTIAVLVGVVLYDKVLAPLMIRAGRPITTLQRIGIGWGWGVGPLRGAPGIRPHSWHLKKGSLGLLTCLIKVLKVMRRGWRADADQGSRLKCRAWGNGMLRMYHRSGRRQAAASGMGCPCLGPFYLPGAPLIPSPPPPAPPPAGWLQVLLLHCGHGGGRGR